MNEREATKTMVIGVRWSGRNRDSSEADLPDGWIRLRIKVIGARVIVIRREAMQVGKRYVWS